MVEVMIDDEKLILSIPRTAAAAGSCFVKPFQFPLENIAGVAIDTSLARSWLKRLEFLARSVPGAIREGVYYEDGNCVFWEVKDPDRTIVISLRNEPHERLIVEVENPLMAVEIIENALKNRESRNEEVDDLTPEEPIEG